MARPRSSRAQGGGARRRRTAEEARRVILDAAEKLLREGGPEGIRLQDVARDVGISHPTILHHFESREGLTRALQIRAMERLEEELFRTLESEPANEHTAVGMLERVFATLGDAGHARLLAWRALGPDPPSAGERGTPILRELAERVHARRVAHRRARGLELMPAEDSELLVRLITVAMLGDGLFGPFVDELMGYGTDPAVRRRFRVWLGRLLVEHLDQP